MTYDAKQMGAKLSRCIKCGVKFYMTELNDHCVLCRRRGSLQSADAVDPHVVIRESCPRA